jgi:hypothetical protein
MRPPLRIAVLECDTPLPDTDSRYHGYGGVFTALLKTSAETLHQGDRLDPETDLQISRWDIMSRIEYPKLGCCLRVSSSCDSPRVLTTLCCPGHVLAPSLYNGSRTSRIQ